MIASWSLANTTRYFSCFGSFSHQSLRKILSTLSQTELLSLYQVFLFLTEIKPCSFLSLPSLEKNVASFIIGEKQQQQRNRNTAESGLRI